MDNTNKGTNNIKQIYDNLTYFDQYGTSLILFILITILLFLFVGACYTLININNIREDWVNQRCKPYVIPIAGLINRPPGVSIKDFTEQNFNYCSQTILKNMTGYAVEPINYTTKLMTSSVNGMEKAVNDIRPMFDKSRNFFKTFTDDVMGRIMNIMTPIQQVVISFKDFIGKILGTLTASLFTALASLMTLKSTFGVMAKFILMALITLSALIAVFWAIPFTWGSAIAATALYLAAAIPMALVLTFMSKVLKIDAGVKIPSIKCFDKNTTFTLKNGNKKPISNLKVGEKLIDDSIITSIICLDTTNSTMYNLNGIIVSNSHIVKYNNKWIPVQEHPFVIKIDNYKEPYLYCINTDKKILELNDNFFTDWDEIFEEDLDKIKNIKLKNMKYNLNDNSNIKNLNDISVDNMDIHKYLDGGFNENTMIKLKNGIIKNIKNVNIGDILENGEKVYGCVQIDGSNIYEQALYNLAKNKFIQGGGNLHICDKKINYTSTSDLDKKFKRPIPSFDNKLYHLLTNTQTFYINGIKFYDYNSCIDLFLEKYRTKLLSMKYV
jgi:hypothetical protein